MSTKFGLVRRLPDGGMLHYSVQPLSSGRDMVRALLLDREGRLWVGHESTVQVFANIPERVPTDFWINEGRLEPFQGCH